VSAARANPGALAYGSTGIGGGNHLAGELFALAAGAKLNHVPYKGSAAALADLLGGQLAFMFDTVITSVPPVRAGRLHAIAVSGAKRASALPDVPTMQEAGVADFEVDSWYAMFVPAKTPRPIIDKLNAALNTVLKEPEIRDKLLAQGSEGVGGPPEALAQAVSVELPKWAKLAKDASIKAE